MSSASLSESTVTLRPLSLRENFSWTLAGNVIYAGCQWGMLVVLAKLTRPELVGQFALGFAISAPVMMLSNLALRAVQATDVRKDYTFGDYLALRLITTSLALVAIAGITAVAGYRWETALVIMTVGLAKAFESVSDVFYGLLQQHERMDRIAKSMALKGPLSLAALVVGAYLTHSVLYGAAGLAVAWALVLLVYDLRSGRLILRVSPQARDRAPTRALRIASLRPRWDLRTLAKLTWLALPLGFATMLISLNTNIPRYVVERLMGERELGIFAAMTYLTVSGTTAIGALGQSATPRLARAYEQRDLRTFHKLLLMLVGFGGLMGVVGILVSVLAGREILTLMYRAEYAVYDDVFIWVMVAMAISYVAAFLGYGMTASHYYRIQPIIDGFSVLVLGGLCLLLVPRYGLAGAAWATCVAMFIQLAGSLLSIAHAAKTLTRKNGGMSHPGAATQSADGETV